jgi:hypothetical protein
MVAKPKSPRRLASASAIGAVAPRAGDAGQIDLPGAGFRTQPLIRHSPSD